MVIVYWLLFIASPLLFFDGYLLESAVGSELEAAVLLGLHFVGCGGLVGVEE